MLKRQRPATPPPSLLGDPPLFLPDGPIRPLHPLHADQPRSKRQRIRPPPLDGTLRGWPESESAGTCRESDGEEDWIEDLHDAPPPPTRVNQYKDANNLLHELHVLNQHRLLFTQSPRNYCLDSMSKALLPTTHPHTQDPSVGQTTANWSDRSPYYPASSELASAELVKSDPCIKSTRERWELIGEVQSVRQRYEGANRLLGSLFLSRRREVQGMTSDLGPSG